MAPQMSAIVVFLGIIALAQAKVLYVKHAPSCVVLRQNGASVLSSDLPQILSVPLGVAQKKDSVLQSKCILKRPAANILFTVHTHDGQEVPVQSVANYAVEWDVPYVDVEQLHNRVQQKFIERQPLVLDVKSINQLLDIKTSSQLFQALPSSLHTVRRDRLTDADSVMTKLVVASALNASKDSDGGLLAELQTVQDVISTLKNNADKVKTKTPDLLSFSLTGLQAIAKEHGANSKQSAEAVELVNRHIHELTEELKAIYHQNVMVEVVIAPAEAAKSRQTRSLKEYVVVNPYWGSLNLALYYGADFPVTFNIVLWLMVILIIFTIFVSYGMWNINPNLDSILYRVPQDESKKLN